MIGRRSANTTRPPSRAQAPPPRALRSAVPPPFCKLPPMAPPCLHGRRAAPRLTASASPSSPVPVVLLRRDASPSPAAGQVSAPSCRASTPSSASPVSSPVACSYSRPRGRLCSIASLLLPEPQVRRSASAVDWQEWDPGDLPRPVSASSTPSAPEMLFLPRASSARQVPRRTFVAALFWFAKRRTGTSSRHISFIKRCCGADEEVIAAERVVANGEEGVAGLLEAAKKEHELTVALRKSAVKH
nr:classical arabinogalactan protein 9-like [Aegilops tauschii subsp. strangulata]